MSSCTAIRGGAGVLSAGTMGCGGGLEVCPTSHLREHFEREIALLDALLVRSCRLCWRARCRRRARAGARPRRSARGPSMPGRGCGSTATTARRAIAGSATGAPGQRRSSASLHRAAAARGVVARRLRAVRARRRASTRVRTRRASTSSSRAGSPRRWRWSAPARPTGTRRWWRASGRSGCGPTPRPGSRGSRGTGRW